MAFRNSIKIFRRYLEHNIALRTLNNYHQNSAHLNAVRNISKPSWFAQLNDKKNGTNTKPNVATNSEVQKLQKQTLHTINRPLTDTLNAEVPATVAPLSGTQTNSLCHNTLAGLRGGAAAKRAVVSMKPGVRHFHTHLVGKNHVRKLLNQELSMRKLLNRALYLTNKCFIQPIKECPQPPDCENRLCGYTDCSEDTPYVPCPKPCFLNPSQREIWSRCSRTCIQGCPHRRELDFCNESEVAQPCYEKMLAPTPSFSECRCNPIPKPILCAECYPTFPSCPKPAKYPTLCQPHPKARRLDCIPRPMPQQKPWSQIERCIKPARCQNPWRADDHYPEKQWKPLPPMFPACPKLPHEQQFMCRHFSTMTSRRAFSTISSRRNDKPPTVLSTIVRRMSLWPPPPCRVLYPKNCKSCEEEPDPCIRELRRRTEGLGCQKEVRPATGDCYRWHKRVNVVVGNVSQYDGRAKPDSPFFPTPKRPFMTLAGFSMQKRGYATGAHMHDTHSTFLPHYESRLIKCRAKCVILKDDIQKLRNQTEGCCIVPEPCSVPRKPMERINPLDVVHEQPCKIPRLWPRPIATKLFVEKNCVDLRNQTEGPPCSSNCRSTFKLPGCTQRYRIDCASALAYFPCKKSECPHPSYSECKEEDPYREIHECTYCQDSITPPKFYQRDPDCSCYQPPCKRTWTLPCEEREKEWVDARSFQRIRAFTTYGITSHGLKQPTGLKRTADELNKHVYDPVTSVDKGYRYSVKAPSDLGTVVYGKFTRRGYSTYSRAARAYSTLKHVITVPKRHQGKLVNALREELRVHPEIADECCKRKCEELEYDCTVDTPENRNKYCKRQRRQTFSCEVPPEVTQAHCLKPNKNIQAKQYSTYSALGLDGTIQSLNSRTTPASRSIDVTPAEESSTNSMTASSTRDRMRNAERFGEVNDNEYGKLVVNRRQLAPTMYPDSYVNAMPVSVKHYGQFMRRMSGSASVLAMPSSSQSNSRSDDYIREYGLLPYRRLLSSAPRLTLSVAQYSTFSSMSAVSTLNRMQSAARTDTEKENKEYAKIITLRRILLNPSLTRRYRTNEKFTIGKLVEVQKVDPLISEECFHRKCKELDQTQEQLGLPPVCPRSPVCNTPENRLKYCHRQRRHTYTCRLPPEPEQSTCGTQIDCWPELSIKTVPVECSTDCSQFKSQPSPQRRRFSTVAAANAEELESPPETDILRSTKETDAVMKSMYDFESKKVVDDWEDLHVANTRNYKKQLDERYENFKNGHIRKHFLSKTLPNDSQQKRAYSTAQPNCVDPTEYKKQQIIMRAQKAAEAAGLELHEHTLKTENPCNEKANPEDLTCFPKKVDLRLAMQCDKPENCYKNPCQNKCQFKTMRQKKRFCDKVCLPGCRPVTERLFCNNEAFQPSCHIKEAPYPSFSESKTFDFSRKKLTECSKADYELYLRQVKSAQFAPLGNDGRGPTESNQCKEYSTLAPAQAAALAQKDESVVIDSQKRTVATSTGNDVPTTCEQETPREDTIADKCKDLEHDEEPEDSCLREPEPERPFELTGDCVCMPFQPACYEIKPGSKPPCTPYELPPPPPPKCRKPCPPPPPPPVVLPQKTCPHGPPVILVDKCKRWRECCRQPPKPPVYPCDEDCKED